MQALVATTRKLLSVSRRIQT